MAEDKKNEFPEDDDFFGDDDDDFGLPDLEYEALEEDDSEEPEPGPVEEKEEEQPVAESVEEEPSVVEEEEPVVEEPEGSLDIGDDLGDIDEASFDDDGDDSELSDDELEELEAELDEELSAEMDQDDMVSDKELEEFYEEESFEEFDTASSTSEAPEEKTTADSSGESVFDSDDSSDDFSSYEDTPLTQENTTYEESAIFTSEEAEKSKSKFTKIVVFGTLIIVGVGFGLIYAYNNFFSDTKEVAKVEKPKSTKKKSSSSSRKKKPVKKTPKKTTSKPAAVKKTPPPKAEPVATTAGKVTAVSSRTGNVFVVVGSFVDGDIANDFANELAAKGKSPSVIAPYGDGLYYRVAIDAYSSIDEAKQKVDSYKGEFGPDVWLLRY